MKTITDPKKIDELLARAVDKIYPSREALRDVLLSGKRLKLYQGFDPTGIKLHLGHMIGLRKLAAWQALGHEVIFLIGDGTGQAGDPSGKTSTREKFHTNKELKRNAKNYVLQAKKVVQFSGSNAAKILYNGDWLNKLQLIDILNIAQNFSWQQLSERDLYRERAKRGEEVNAREFLYPLLQAYDSVFLKVDLEQGGTDQTFNMLAGRTLMKKMLGKEKFVLTTPLLTDSSGRKIGKTEGNVIALDDTPEKIFGAIMAFPDEVIVKCFEYLTTVPMAQVELVAQKIAKGENPMDLKKELAFVIVSELHSRKLAEKARENFTQTFQLKEIPLNIQEVVNKGKLLETIISSGMVASTSEIRRLFSAGAVTDMTEGRKVFKDENAISGHTYKIGKRKFIKLK